MRGPVAPAIWILAITLGLSEEALCQRTADPLAPLVACVNSVRFPVIETSRLPEAVRQRGVQLPEGMRHVSLMDGYRVLLGTEQGEPFVNLKLELSEPASAAADRAVILAQMRTFSELRPPAAKALTHVSTHGVETWALHQPTLERGGPISFYTFFVPARDLVATMYVLNQDPARRVFASYEQYEALRDEAVAVVQACLAQRV